MRPFILFLLALVLVLGAAGAMAPDLPFRVPGGYATLHVVGCAVAAFLAGLLWRPLAAVAAGVVALAICAEAIQLLLPDRTFSLVDIGFDVLGAALGVSAAAIARPRETPGPDGFASSAVEEKRGARRSYRAAVRLSETCGPPDRKRI